GSQSVFTAVCFFNCFFFCFERKHRSNRTERFFIRNFHIFRRIHQQGWFKKESICKFPFRQSISSDDDFCTFTFCIFYVTCCFFHSTVINKRTNCNVIFISVPDNKTSHLLSQQFREVFSNSLMNIHSVSADTSLPSISKFTSYCSICCLF